MNEPFFIAVLLMVSLWFLWEWGKASRENKKLYHICAKAHQSMVVVRRVAISMPCECLDEYNKPLPVKCDRCQIMEELS